MKRITMTIVAGLFLATAAGAQIKIAVLDAVISRGIDSSVVIPVTEKVMERLVVSGRYIVLDRANVDKVLGEREFQVSGLVSDDEISAAGKYLGANFVVAIRVQRVSQTYFLSAKMIAVDTGVITTQASAEGEGRLSILLNLAEQVGDLLSGVETRTTGDTAGKKTDSPKSDAPGTPAARTGASRKSASNSSIGTRVYLGWGGGLQDFQDAVYYYDAFETTIFDAYGIWGFGNHFCLLGNLTYQDSGSDSGAATLSADVGLGYAHPVGILMPWIGAKIGFAFLDWPDYTYYYASHADLEYGFDLGLDIRMGRLLLGARYQLTASSFSGSGSYDLSVVQHSFLFMAGLRF